MQRIKLFIFLFFLAWSTASFSQPSKVIDEVVAVVGNHLILYSDIRNELIQMEAQGIMPDANSPCLVLEELLFQKLLLHQAELDSVTVSDAQVNAELDQRMRYYIAQMGSEKKLEEFMGKSISELKDDYRDDLERILLARTMQNKITGELKVTPGEVRSYFNSIPRDSLPLISSEVELRHIVRTAPVNEKEKKAVREKLEKLRERIVAGEDFATLAILYSKDGSAASGGELGFKTRAELVPEFAAAGFSLKGKEVSPVIESMYGFHIIQMIERKGEQANLRHILLTPEVSGADLLIAKTQLDSISNLIKNSDITFEAAALKYSEDPDSKNNSGNIINPSTGTTRFTMEELDPGLFFIIDKMKPGEISAPVKYTTNDGKQAYRIVYLTLRTEPHKANLKEDYQRIQGVALNNKQNTVLKNWISKKRPVTYVRIAESYKSCKFRYNWLDDPSQTKK